MPRNSSDKFAIAHRRQVVARLRLKRYTELEITAELVEQGIVNPTTGAPYDKATVHRDLKALEREWKEAAAEDIAQLKGEMVAALQEVQRVAWRGRYGNPQLSLVLKALAQEAQVLGLVGGEYPRQREEDRVSEAVRDFRAGAEAARAVYRAQQRANGREEDEPS